MVELQLIKRVTCACVDAVGPSAGRFGPRRQLRSCWPRNSAREPNATPHKGRQVQDAASKMLDCAARSASLTENAESEVERDDDDAAERGEDSAGAMIDRAAADAMTKREE